MKSVFTGLSILTFLLSLAACGGGESVDEHIARANQFLADSEYKAAIIELKNALQKENQSAEARWLLGKVYLARGDILSAEKELRRALDLGWTENEVMPALAEALLAQRKYAEVFEVRPVDLQPQAESKLLATKAMAAISLGQNAKAEKLVDLALEKTPGSNAALLAKARILASQGDLAGAQTILDNLLAQNPENVAAWILIGDLNMGQRQPQEALLAYDRGLALAPRNFTALVKRALLSLQLQNYDMAQTDASTLLQIAPQNPAANYIQGLIHFQAARYNEAVTSLSLAEPVFKQFPVGIFFLGSAQLVEGKLDQAEFHAVHFHKVMPDSIRGRKLLATVRLQQGKYAEVQELVRPVLDNNPNDVGALNLMSNALLRDGKADEGITLLAKVAELQPDSPTAQVRLGAGLLAGGKGDAAMQHIEAALELNPEYQQADILLVMNHMQEQDYEAAIQAAKAYRQRNLTSTTPVNLLGRVYLAAGQPDQARASFGQALKLDPLDAAANYNLGQIAAADGDVAGARQYYATILEHNADNIAALMQLALLDAKEGDGESLVERLDQAIAAHPTAIAPRLMLARYYYSEGRPEKVAPVFADLDERQQKLPQVLGLQALAQLSQDEHSQAQYTLDQLMGSNAESAALHHLMAMAAAGSGDTARTEKELHRALELNEDFLPSRITLAKLSLASGSQDEFDRHMQKLTVLSPEHPDVLLLQAASARRKGDAALAVKLARQAYAAVPSTATVLALASYEKSAGDPEAAKKLYRSWLEENPDDAAVLMAIATDLQGVNAGQEAKVYYERIVALGEDNLVALNNLAWLIREENPGKALEYARKASSLAPDSASVLDTLAVVEFINKDYKQAQGSIRRALRQEPDNPSMVYHQAMILAAAGDETAAIGILQKLLETGVEFPELDQANALLTDLGG